MSSDAAPRSRLMLLRNAGRAADALVGDRVRTVCFTGPFY
jgi:hypothetical protein